MKSLKHMILGSCLCTAFLTAEEYTIIVTPQGAYSAEDESLNSDGYNESGYQSQGYSDGRGNGYMDGRRGMGNKGPSAEQMSQVSQEICTAISAQKRIEVILQGKEVTSKKEMKIVTKRLVIEPYAFGMTVNQQPFLRGNVAEDKVVKEVDVKYTDDKFDDTKAPADKQENSIFSNKTATSTGWFSSSGSTGVENIDLRQIRNLRVLDNTRFDAPKDYSGFRDDRVQILCELPLTNTTTTNKTYNK